MGGATRGFPPPPPPPPGGGGGLRPLVNCPGLILLLAAVGTGDCRQETWTKVVRKIEKSSAAQCESGGAEPGLFSSKPADKYTPLETQESQSPQLTTPRPIQSTHTQTNARTRARAHACSLARTGTQVVEIKKKHPGLLLCVEVSELCSACMHPHVYRCMQASVRTCKRLSMVGGV